MSAAGAAPRMAFNGLWPTLLVKRRLPGFEQPTAGLAAYIAEQEAREADYTARFHEQNFLASENAAVRWLKDQIDQTPQGRQSILPTGRATQGSQHPVLQEPARPNPRVPIQGESVPVRIGFE